MKTTCLKGNKVLELIGAGLRLLVLGGYDAAQLAIRICGREDPDLAGNPDHREVKGEVMCMASGAWTGYKRLGRKKD